MWGLNESKVRFKDYVLEIPTDLFRWPIWRCKLVTSTMSESNNPNVPTPAPAKYIAKGQPIPPQPIIAILEFIIFYCP